MTAAMLTILFTDIEGSTRMARALGERWPEVIAAHHAAVGDAIAAHDGQIESASGDAFFALFASAGAAVAAAADAQRRLGGLSFPVKVRMGLHRGDGRRDEHGLTGLDIHLAARVEAAAHGGQVVMTSAVREALDDGVTVADLGEHRLKDFPHPEPLHQLVYEGRGPDLSRPLPPDRLPPTNLGAETRPLVGRDDDLERLADLLVADGRRLVTVTGPGGAGKTRLAIAAGERLLSDFPGGVWLVPLAQLRDADAILGEIALAAGVPDHPARTLSDMLAEHLRARRMLLVLDNLEHLDGAAEVIAPLLPDAQVLATSQLPLRVPAE